MYTYNIEVLRVIDGDTIDASIDLGFDVKPSCWILLQKCKLYRMV